MSRYAQNPSLGSLGLGEIKHAFWSLLSCHTFAWLLHVLVNNPRKQGGIHDHKCWTSQCFSLCAIHPYVYYTLCYTVHWHALLAKVVPCSIKTYNSGTLSGTILKFSIIEANQAKSHPCIQMFFSVLYGAFTKNKDSKGHILGWRRTTFCSPKNHLMDVFLRGLFC